jgi:hypothetical protein
MSRMAFDIDQEFEREDEKMLRLNSDMCVSLLAISFYIGSIYTIWRNM